jgi:hypothetical protein
MSFDCGYLLVKSVLSERVCHILSTYCLLDEKVNPNFDSMDVPDTHFKTSDLLSTSLLLSIMPEVESHTRMELVPTSSHFRVYRKGSFLTKHHDQDECCQVTASINVGAYLPEGYAGWPVYLEDHPFVLDVGDMLLFKGNELFHSRNVFDVPEDCYQIQFFMHYVQKGTEITDQYKGVEGVGFL